MKTKKLRLQKETVKRLASVGGTFLPPTSPCPGTFESPTAIPTAVCSNNCL